MEHVLEESGISVALPSRHSQHLVPQVPDQGPNLESRQHHASEVSEPEDNTEKSASPYEGIIIIIIIVSYIYTCIVDSTTTPSWGPQKEGSTPKGNKHSSRPLPHEGIIIWTCTWPSTNIH